ncbi:MAG: flagellar assembly protein FliW [Clostridia bacterium]|nr:flagellar assembly protein FliW [Clostridia bacterium]
MKIATTRFGEIEVDETKVIVFDKGLLGFENLKKYVLISSDKKSAFYWLQSIEEPSVALVCMDPFNVCKDYSPIIDEAVADELQIDKDEDVLILCVAVIPNDVAKTTVNLAAPILINNISLKGKQVILQDDRYSIRHLVFKQEDA